MSETGSLKCPNCGGVASPDSVKCSWCGSHLATVACPKCFASIFVGMTHCPYCGTAASRVEIKGGEQWNCPRCDVPLQPVQVGKNTLSECTQCGGLWVSQQAFEQICEERDEQQAVIGMSSPAPGISPSNQRSTARMYIRCPQCGNLMNRMNYASCSGVVIDWCKGHGSWFDARELRQIVAFVQQGGLKKSRQREIERLQEETQRLRRQERELAAQQSRQAAGSGVNDGWRNDHGLLADILSAIWRGRPD